MKYFSYKLITLCLFILFSFSLTTGFSPLNSNGKAGFTGSPGEAKCSNCHSGGSASVFGSSLTAVPAFTNNQYLPDSIYTVTLQANAGSFTKFGLALECLNASSANTGTLQNPSPGTTLVNAGNGRKNIIHAAPLLTNNGVLQVSFTWKAPSAGAGLSTFYYCLNAVNGNNNTSGDFVFSNLLSLTEGSINTNTTGIAQHNAAFDCYGYQNTLYFKSVAADAWPLQVSILGLNGGLLAHTTFTTYTDRWVLNDVIKTTGFYSVRIESATGKRLQKLLYLEHSF
ncbi:MAG: choice-of-anchor V domain-containing protein [Bacteroidia bacterium]